jgi:hypothetical protein
MSAASQIEPFFRLFEHFRPLLQNPFHSVAHLAFWTLAKDLEDLIQAFNLSLCFL